LDAPRTRPETQLRSYAIIAIGGFFFALDLAFYNTSILQTNAANATLLGNNTPIAVGLLTWLVFSSAPNASFWIGLALAVAGSLVIMGADLARHAKFGLGTRWRLLLRRASLSIFSQPNRFARTQVRWNFCASQFFPAPFSVCVHADLRVPLGIPDRRTFLALLGLGLVSQLGGYLALTYALGHLPATVTSVSLLSQGPLTAVLAALLLGEPLSVYQIAGVHSFWWV